MREISRVSLELLVPEKGLFEIELMCECLYRMQVNYVEMETSVSTSKITLFHRSDADNMFLCKLANLHCLLY